MPGANVSVKNSYPIVETQTDFNGKAKLNLEDLNVEIRLSILGPNITFKLFKNVDYVKVDIKKEKVEYYSENKILYKKVIINGISVYVYSNVSTDELYNVKFSLVGNNLGNYILSSAAAVGKIYQYIAPVNGIPQGNYEPIVRLIAPTEIQIATVLGKFNPSEKTNVDFIHCLRCTRKSSE